MSLRQSTTNGKDLGSKLGARELIQRAYSRIARSAARPRDVAEFEKLIAEYPDDVPDRVTDLARRAMALFVHATGCDESLAAVLRHSFDRARRDFGYELGTPTERLLIDQVALCFVRLNQWEAVHAGLKCNAFTAKLCELWERRLSAAQLRYLRAVETLVRVRRLLNLSIEQPVQVNVAAEKAVVALA